MIDLRDYQTRAVNDVLGAFADGILRVLLVAPTGSGKSVMFAALATLFHAAGLRVLVVAHREELIEQAVAKLRAAGVARVGVYRGARNSRDLDGATCVVAAIQARGLADFGADLVIVDEAHHTPANSYARLLELFPTARHVGATATPWWGRGYGLGGYFQRAVTATTPRELMARGHLARVRVFTHPHTLRDLDLLGVGIGAEDYRRRELVARVDRPELVGDIVAHWQSHAEQARTLCFAASVDHSRHITERFRAAGVAAEHIDGRTPSDERRATIARLRSGETRVVSNYAVLTEGFDEPSVGCIILARPTRRAQVYIQTIGRGLRVAEGKDSVVVLDHAGSCLAFGLPDADWLVPLDASPSDPDGAAPPLRRCPACGLMVHSATKTCPECAERLRATVATADPEGQLVEVLARPREGQKIEYRGRTLTVLEWSRETGLPVMTIYRRLRKGLGPEKVLARPRTAVVIEFNGVRRTAAEWAKATGVKEFTINARLRRGLPMDQVFAPVTKTISAFGKSLSAHEWARDTGIAVDVIHKRLRDGEDPETALARPATKAQTLTHGGKTQTVAAWAEELGLRKEAIYKRLWKGLPMSEVLSPSRRARRRRQTTKGDAR